MARAPWLAGKTRLAVGDEPSHAALRHALFLDTLDAVRAVSGAQPILAVDPPDTAERIRDLVGGAIDVMSQRGADLGERLRHVIEDAFRLGAESVVVVGSDLPDLPAERLHQAFDALGADPTRVVIGPADDGGYYLIGMRGYSDVLREVPMSTPDAASTLIANARNRQLTWLETDPTFDVDVYDDLPLLIGELDPDGGNCPCTWRRLHELGLW